MAAKTPITVAYGDGIGPEIMDATLHVLAEAGAALDIEKVSIGEQVYNRGIPTGIEPSTWDSLRRTKVFLKSPITTPQGGGFKSLNVTIRTALGLYANVRPCASYHPFVQTKHPIMDVVIVRENEEDLYTGIEYHQTPDSYEALKLISRPGSEKIVRYAFEYALHNNRKKVTCFTKDNIMKMTDGLFHKVFDEIAAEYPQISHEHWIVDIGAAKLAETPEAFDVIVLPNLYGDILSDVAAQITGSVGLAGSANIGEKGAMFEAIHGSAPKRAGQNSANPSGLLLASVLMLIHIKQPEVAASIHNAWLRTIEDGVHTHDIFREGVSKRMVTTREFAEEIVKRLGQKPQRLKEVLYSNTKQHPSATQQVTKRAPERKELVGVDVYFQANETPDGLQKRLSKVNGGALKLTMISNRGSKVWPEGQPETFCIDHWRCRYLAAQTGGHVKHQQIVELLGNLASAEFDFIKTEHLYTFNDHAGFS